MDLQMLQRLRYFGVEELNVGLEDVATVDHRGLGGELQMSSSAVVVVRQRRQGERERPKCGGHVEQVEAS